MKNVIFLLVLGLTLSQCKYRGDTGGSSSSFDEEDLNAPAEGFDLESSDPLAIVIADRVMHAMGGRRAWDQTRYLSWNFLEAANYCGTKRQDGYVLKTAEMIKLFY